MDFIYDLMQIVLFQKSFNTPLTITVKNVFKKILKISFGQIDTFNAIFIMSFCSFDPTHQTGFLVSQILGTFNGLCCLSTAGISIQYQILWPAQTLFFLLSNFRHLLQYVAQESNAANYWISRVNCSHHRND